MLENNLRGKYIISDGTHKTYSQVIAENIKVSEQLRCEIYKESDIFRMLDLSLLCISTMTGDSVFYNHNRKKLLDIICKWEGRAT